MGGKEGAWREFWSRLAGWLIETLCSALLVHRVEAFWIMLLRKWRLRRVVNLAFVIERHASCKTGT